MKRTGIFSSFVSTYLARFKPEIQIMLYMASYPKHSHLCLYRLVIPKNRLLHQQQGLQCYPSYPPILGPSAKFAPSDDFVLQGQPAKCAFCTANNGEKSSLENCARLETLSIAGETLSQSSSHNGCLRFVAIEVYVSLWGSSEMEEAA